MKTILEETIGFACCVSICRIYDMALCFDFKRLNTLEEMAIGQSFIIKLAKYMIIRRKKFITIENFTKEMKAFQLIYETESIVKEVLKYYS
jgi:5-methylthioribose kinase